MKTILLSTILLFGLFSCNSKKGTTKSEKLTNSSWEVILLGAETPKSIQTLIITDNSLKGKGACNSFGGKIILNDSNLITISDIMSTKMGCDKLSEENNYFESLRNSINYTLVKEELSFYNLNNELLVKFKKIK